MAVREGHAFRGPHLPPIGFQDIILKRQPPLVKMWIRHEEADEAAAGSVSPV